MLEQYDLSNLLVLDIETVPQYATHDELPEHFKKLWDLKTQRIRKDETAEEFYESAGIWAEFGKIICISVGVFTGGSVRGMRVKSFAGHDEKELLESFRRYAYCQPPSLILVAHNGKEFDFPYICRRMLINGLTLPKQLRDSRQKALGNNHLDTMELWKFGDYKSYTSLIYSPLYSTSPPQKTILTAAWWAPFTGKTTSLNVFAPIAKRCNSHSPAIKTLSWRRTDRRWQHNHSWVIC
jgi:hypothetical protein